MHREVDSDGLTDNESSDDDSDDDDPHSPVHAYHDGDAETSRGRAAGRRGRHHHRANPHWGGYCEKRVAFFLAILEAMFVTGNKHAVLATKEHDIHKKRKQTVMRTSSTAAMRKATVLNEKEARQKMHVAITTATKTVAAVLGNGQPVTNFCRRASLFACAGGILRVLIAA